LTFFITSAGQKESQAVSCLFTLNYVKVAASKGNAFCCGLKD